ncbi:MAG: tRNA (adenosine(37)-N6)-dimethylallyltransferase MiaA [Mariprofundaceae bacterium]
MSDSAQLNVIALMGATGSGKSALAMQLMEESGNCIISCDSMQVYRGLDIGTAKPGAIEQKAVPHLLIDCVTLPEIYSAAHWASDASVIIHRENEAGRTPLIVGGTGLYLRALLEGFSKIPPEDMDIRRYLEARLERSGLEVMYQSLELCDAETASRLNPNDTQRIMRALAIYETTGKPLSAWHKREQVLFGTSIAVGGSGESAKQDLTPFIFVLDVERKVLRRHLEERFHLMLGQGWLDEVRWLADQNLPDTHPVMRAVGYRQLLSHVLGECSLEQAISDGITATRRYAKRQETWFRHQVPTAVRGDAETLRQKIKAL